MDAVPLIVGYRIQDRDKILCLVCHRKSHRGSVAPCTCIALHEGGNKKLFCESCGQYLNNVVITGPVFPRGGIKPLADQKAQFEEARRLHREGCHG